AAHREGAIRRHEVAEQLGAVDDGDALRARRGEVRHLFLDRGRDDERRAAVGDAAPVLGHDFDAEALKLRTKLGALAAVEGAIAAADAPAHHRLELRKRAHAGTAKPRVMESSRALRIGNDEIRGLRNQHVVAFAHVGEQATDAGVGKAHAAMRDGTAKQKLVIGAVKIDVALKRILPRTALDALLQSIEGQNAGEDEIVVARLAAPPLAGRLAGYE